MAHICLGSCDVYWLMTNSLFGLVCVTAYNRRHFWPWVDHLLFWGMNLGLAGFVVGMILQSPEIKRAFSPIIGISILITILAYSIRLYEGRVSIDE